jgi:hypothetical protein
MYAANETGAVWSVDTLFEAGPGELLLAKEPTQEDLARAFPVYRDKYAERLCAVIDSAADSARQTCIGDPLRAAEYQRTASEALAFKDAGYPLKAVPRAVASWAINGRTAREAADDILRESDRYDEALYTIREQRLGAKERIRSLVDEGKIDQARTLADQACKGLSQAVVGTVNI